jgi:hypothetical protein
MSDTPPTIYTSEVHERNLAMLRRIWKHLHFLNWCEAWHVRETQWGSVLTWTDQEPHPLREGDFRLALPNEFRPIILAIRDRPETGDDGMRGTTLATPWVCRNELCSMPKGSIPEPMRDALINAFDHIQDALNKTVERRSFEREAAIARNSRDPIF